jgi:hypothetical protein
MVGWMVAAKQSPCRGGGGIIISKIRQFVLKSRQDGEYKKNHMDSREGEKKKRHTNSKFRLKSLLLHNRTLIYLPLLHCPY